MQMAKAIVTQSYDQISNKKKCTFIFMTMFFIYMKFKTVAVDHHRKCKMFFLCK